MNKRWNYLLLCVLVLLSVYMVIFVSGEAINLITLNQLTNGSLQSKNATYFVGPGTRWNFTVNATVNFTGGVLEAFNASIFTDLNGSWAASNNSVTYAAGIDLGEVGRDFISGLNQTLEEGVYRFNVVAVHPNGSITGQKGAAAAPADGPYNNGSWYNWSSSSNYTFFIDKSNITLGNNQSTTDFNLTDGYNVRYNSSTSQNFSDVGIGQTYVRNGTSSAGTINVTFVLQDAAIENVTLKYNTDGKRLVMGECINNCSVGVRGLELTDGTNGSIGTWVNATGGGFGVGGLPRNKNTFTASFPGFADNLTVQWVLLVNDTAGNHRLFGPFNFTTDGSAPTGTTLSVDKTSVPTTGNVKVTCGGSSDLTSGVAEIRYRWVRPGGTEIIKTEASLTEVTFGVSDFGGVPGQHQVYCRTTDNVGLQTTETGPVAVTVYLSTTSGSSGSSGAKASVAELDISTQVAPSGTLVRQQGETETFTLDGSSVHTITFLTVGATSATLRFESEPVDVTLSVGETKSVDVDGDGVEDIEVTLNSIKDGKADVSIENLDATVEVESDTEESVPGAEVLEDGSSTGGSALWITLLVIAVVLVVGYLLVKKSSGKGKKGEIKFSKKDLMDN